MAGARRLPPRAAASWPAPILAAVYLLLVLQPLLAITGSMLHGDRATMFGIPLPAVLPMDRGAALAVDRLHGGNAVLLLALIAAHIAATLRLLRHSVRSAA